MEGRIMMPILIMLIAVHAAYALEAKKVLHIPEKIIGGVIDLVQSHKNKPTQQTAYQSQGQQQLQQGHGWNSGYQGQNQNQEQHQYGNYGYPQTGQSYPQGGYVNYGQGSGYQQFGGTQMQNQGQYQNYPQNPSGQFQLQNQQATNTFDHQQQFQNQAQNGIQSQMQLQNQNQNQNMQFQNQNQQSNLNFQGNQQVNQQLSHNQNTASYGNNQQSGNVANNQQSNYIGQVQPQGQHYYGVSSYPHGQVTQSTFQGQNHQSTQFISPTVGQTGSGSSYGGSQNFQMSNGQPAPPGPTCVCQAWTKPINDPLNNTPSQRNEEKTETPK